MIKKISAVVLILFSSSLAQPWLYEFGTSVGTYNIANTISTAFLPQPTTNGGEDLIRMSNGAGGSFNLENQVISFGALSYLRIVAPTSGSVNKFSIYDYLPAQAFTLRFNIRFGASDGSAIGASSGNWYLFVGDGDRFSNGSGFVNAQTFLGLRWGFNISGTITTSVLNAGLWVSLSGTPFSQGTDYLVEIAGNNSASTINYTYGSSQSVAQNKFDIWVNGLLVGDDIGKSLLPDLANIDSWMFYGEESAGNVANIFLDNFEYSNQIENPLPVELTSFSGFLNNDNIKLNWETATEVNNYGFDIERNTPLIPLSRGEVDGNNVWEKIGFVNGNGNSNSPKSYSFIDNNVSAGSYLYRLKQIDNDGQFEYSKTVEVSFIKPDAFALEQNYPNPFNPTTKIKYTIPSATLRWQSHRHAQGDILVSLKVFDVLGNEVAALVNETQQPGTYEVKFNADKLSSGVYYYRLQAGNIVENRKMVLLH
ncbi:MAG: T9SS type A sorting domain-containing protein [Ignavibacteriales bacterium]|nr:T9SS type A sorting domain-containing protein [Ignavibacteriales bacterium]